MEIRVHLLQGATMPTRKTTGSIGFDLYANISEPVQIVATDTVLVPTGVWVEFPVYYYGEVFIRSGVALAKALSLANGTGLIDTDYRGEIKVALYNRSRFATAVVFPQERIAQLVFKRVTPVSIIDALNEFKLEQPTEAPPRGDGGFGSTGNF